MQRAPSAKCPFQLKPLFEVAKEPLQAGAPLAALEKIKLTVANHSLHAWSLLTHKQQIENFLSVTPL